jgi:L-seryl-tRNA(Ser) seleniumtransferase
MSNLRAIPAVEKVLRALGETELPRPLVVAAVRRELAALRAERAVPEFAAVLARVRAALERLRLSRIQPVINGTGVLIHTNLGRAPLGPTVVDTLRAIAADYNNLEYDLDAGARGARATYLESCLALLCGAEAATVTNNCAAALVLILRHFTAGKRSEVIISRGELVQIGGGFRIPEILEASGARLREVGTTNQTSLDDYARAIGPATALILKVHRSNFFMDGFIGSPATEEVATLARRKRLPCVEDLGSGALVETEAWGGLEHEPTPAEVLARGVDVVCFSGDKLLGGPQAGIIAGQARLVTALKREPFFRALRCDKLILAALQTTAERYLHLRAAAPGRCSTQIPVLDMLQQPLDSLRARAEEIRAALESLPVHARLGAGEARIGGGTLPRALVASVTIDLRPIAFPASELAGRLRRGRPPVIGYVSGGKLRLDLRTVFPAQDDLLPQLIRHALEPEDTRSRRA